MHNIAINHGANMNYVLFLLAVSIALTLVYWMDKKNKMEKSEAERMHDLIFGIMNGLQWNMDKDDIKYKFGDKDFVTAKEFTDSAATGYFEHLDGIEILVSFYFKKSGAPDLVRTDFHLRNAPEEKYNLLFTKLSDTYGEPMIDEEYSGGRVLWIEGDTVFTFETSEENEAQLRFWNKEYFEHPAQDK